MTNIFLIICTTLMLSSAQNMTEKTLLDAAVMKSGEKWRIVNDGVMGGLSTSKVFTDNNAVVFSGDISLKNNGGFASLRSPVRSYDFSGFSGIEVKLKSDGHIYSISMKETSYFTGYFYTATFQSKEDEWLVVKIPFKDFRLNYFGRELKRNTPIPLSKIKEVSFVAGNKEEGKFTAEIEYVKLY